MKETLKMISRAQCNLKLTFSKAREKTEQAQP